MRQMKRATFAALILALSLLTAFAAAAQGKDLMPPLDDGRKRECLDCHRRPNVNTNEGVLANQAFCFECHGQEACVREVDGKTVSLKVPAESFGPSSHKYAACIQCHTDVARSPHRTETGAECFGCHPVHGGGKEPHLRVDCQACHRRSDFVTLDARTGRIRLAHVNAKKEPITLTDHALPDVSDPDFCLRCHTAGNPVGASASVLPEKSILCIVCHEAPLRLGHWIFWLAALVFLFGIFIQVQLWLRGSVAGEEESTHKKISAGAESLWSVLFSREFWSIIKTFILDVLLQRRLLKESVKRWFIHSLIYLAILARFALGVLTLTVFSIDPEGSWSLALVDKNHPFTAFVYDLSGLLILIGIVWAALQRFIIKPKHTVAEIQDTTALVIIGLLVLAGFILEGARILMTGVPMESAAYSFVGCLIAAVFSVFNIDWTSIYPVLWYIHALLGAALIAWLPYSKMRHVFVTPLSLIMNRKLR